MSLGECYWSLGAILTSECWSYPSYAFTQIVTLVVFILLLRVLIKRNRRNRLEWETARKNARENAEKEHQKRINIDGAESWSLDEVDLRILQLERIINRVNSNEILSALSQVFGSREREEIEGARSQGSNPWQPQVTLGLAFFSSIFL